MASRLSILFSLLVAFGVATIAAPSAHAQGKGDKQDVKEAQKHFKRANAHRELEEYAQAAKEYLAAYELYPDPEFFFLAGEVYQLNGDKREALAAFKKYVGDDPDGRAVTEAKKYIKLLEKDIEREDAANKPDRPAGDDDDDTATDDDDDDNAAGDDDDTTSSDDDDDDSAAGSGPSAGSPGKGKKIGGLVMFGVGAIALGLGGYFGSQAASISDEISEISGTWTQDDTDRFEEGEAAERNMFILYGVGAASVIAGGVLYYLGATAKADGAERGDMSFAPTLTGSSVGFAASGSF